MKKALLIIIINLILLNAGMAQWQSSNNGLYGGFVDAIAVDPTTNYVYAGTINGGVYQSTDNGDNWVSINNGLKAPWVHCFAFRGNNIFAGAYNAAFNGGGIFLSTDNGSSWKEINNGLPAGSNSTVESIAIDGNNIFAGLSGSGVFLSQDNGSTWQAVNTGLLNKDIRSIVITGNNIFAGTSGGIYLSTNNGNNWQSVSNGLSGDGLNIQSLAISGSNIFAGTYYGGIYLSTDNGNSWNPVNNGLPGGVWFSFAVSGSNIYAGTYGGGIYLSNDNGGHWSEVNSGLFGLDLSVRAITISGNKILAGTNNGISLSINYGNSWSKKNNGLACLQINALGSIGNNIFAGTSNNGVFLSSDNGNNWVAVNNGLSGKGLMVNAIATSGNNIFAATYGGLFLSTDNGNSWRAVNNGLLIEGNSLWSMAINSNTLFTGTFNQGIFLSTDNGSSWTQVNSGLPNLYVRSISFSDNNVYASIGSAGIFKSIDNGNNWAAVNNGLNNLDISCLAASDTRIFAGGYGIYFSNNSGTTWTAVNNGLTPEKKNVQAITIEGANIFSGSYGGGVSLSIDNGSNWKDFSDGLPGGFGLAVNSFITNGNSIFAGTYTGLWKREIPAAAKLILSKNTLSIAAPANSTKTFDITSNTNWTISSDQPWLVPNVLSSSGNETITLTAQANNSSSPRTASITVSGTEVTSQNITVTQDGTPSPSAGKDQQLCGTLTTIMEAVPSFGTGIWTKQSGPGIVTFSNPNSPTSNATASLYGDYFLYWTETDGINSAFDGVNINFSPQPVPTITGPANLCLNSTGNVYTTEAGMTDYSWSVSSGGTITGGSGTNSIIVTWNNTGSQTVSVNYTYNNNCEGSTPTIKIIEVNPLPTITTSGNINPVCYNGGSGQTGNLLYSASTGNPNMYSIDWDAAANAAGLQDLNNPFTSSANGGNLSIPIIPTPPEGIYSGVLTITNATNCTSAQVITLTVNPSPTININFPQPFNEVCYSGIAQNYTLFYGPTTNNPTSYTIDWNAAGNSAGLMDQAPTAFAFLPGGGNLNNMIITGNTSPGTYIGLMTIMNGNGCFSPVPVSATINLPPISQTITKIPNISDVCTGAPVSATFSGGLGGVNPIDLYYSSTDGSSWQPYVPGSNIFAFSPGANMIKIRTERQSTSPNCMISATNIVTWNVVPQPLAPVINVKTPSSLSVCQGLPVSAIFNSGTGGNGCSDEFQYRTKHGTTWTSWSVYTSGFSITTSGIDQVEIQGRRGNCNTQGGCVNTSWALLASWIVGQPPVPSISGPSQVALNSVGNLYTTEAGMSGYDWVVSSGGTITGGLGTNTIIVTWNTSGEHTVRVNYINGNNCSSVIPTVYNVTVSSPLSGLIISKTNISCFGAATGSITVGGNGGVEPYEYKINTGSYQSSGTYNSLPAASYTITIRDATLKTFDVQATITEPATSVSGSILSKTNISTFGATDGQIVVDGSGGTSPYQYKLGSGLFQSSGTFGGLGVGNYNITIRDLNNCFFELPVIITQNANCGPVTDIDGNTYNTVTIGDQCWMQENLKTTKFNNGVAIPLVTDNTIWAGLLNSAYCWYNNDISYKPEYGAMYNWFSVNSGILCPSGWHVPTDSEWKTLTTYLGGENISGKKLKESGTVHWFSPNSGTNETGFTSLPGGSRYETGVFYFQGYEGSWWSSTEETYDGALNRYMYNHQDNVNTNWRNKKNGLSVRCIKEDPSSTISSTLTGSGDACNGSTSTIKSVITGGTAPYTINYNLNGVAQPAVTGYISGSDISLGILPLGANIIEITSIEDANSISASAVSLPPSYTINIYGIPDAGTTVNNLPFICNNETTDIVLHSDIPNTDFTYTVSYSPATTWQSGKAPVAGTILNGEGVSIAQNLAHNSTEPVYVTYTISSQVQGNVSCSGPSINVVVAVNPIGQVNQPSNLIVCNGEVVPAVSFSTINTPAISTFLWTNNNTTIGLAGWGFNASEVPSFTAVNTGNNSVTATIVVTPIFINGGSCIGPTKTFTITVRPTPKLTSTLTPNAICSNNIFSYNPTSATTGTTFNWSRAFVAGISNIAASGTGNPNEILINTTTSPVSVRYVYSLTANNCTNYSTYNVDVVVNPKPQLTINNPAAVCTPSKVDLTAATVTSGSASGLTYTYWTNASATTPYPTPAAAVAGTYYIKGLLPVTGCFDVKPVTATVNPLPVLTSTLTPASVCSSTTFSYNPSSSITGTTFSWTRATVAGIINSAGAGTGNASETIINSTAVPVTVHYIYTLMANGCTNPSTFDVAVVVNPTPVLSSTLTPAAICSNLAFSYTPVSATPGISFAWSRAAVTGISNSAASGTGSINETLINTTTSPQVVTYVYSLTANGCTNSQNVSITVNPTPILSSTLTPMAVCSGATFSYTPTCATPGTTFSWDRASVAGISNAPSTGTFAVSEILINTTVSAIPVTYVFTLVSTGCVNIQNVTVTVNPEPVITSSNSSTICSGDLTNVTLNSNVSPASYTWSLGPITGGITGATAGSGTTINQLLNNTGLTAGTVTYIVRSISGSCTGDPTSIVVTVNPATGQTTFTSGNMVVCQDAPDETYTAIATNSTSVTYSVSPAIAGTINNLTGVMNWEPAFYGPATITVTSTGICGTTSTNRIITVNPTTGSPVFIAGKTSVCQNSADETYTATAANSASISYSISPSTAGVINSSTGVMNWDAAFAGTATITATANGFCGTTSSDRIVTVNSIPTLNITNPASVCSPGTTDLSAATITSGSTSGLAYTYWTNAGATIAYITPATAVAGTYYIKGLLPATGCFDVKPVTVTVNPLPVLTSTLTPGSICSNTTFSYNPASSITGTTFSWTRATVAGINNSAGAGTGNPSETLINSSSAPVTVHYIYTLSANGCTNTATFDVAVVVNPSPVLISTLTPAAICSNSVFSYTPVSVTTGTIFDWNRAAVAGISNSPVSGNGNPNETLMNITTVPVVVTYSYTLTANGCSNAQNVTVNVNPKPVLSSTLTPPAVCSNSAFNYTPASATQGTSFSWSRAAVAGINNSAATGTTIVNEILINITTSPKVVTYVYSLTANGCTNSQNVSVTVNPTPILSSTLSPMPVCSDAVFNYTPTCTTSGTTFSWVRPIVAGISNATSTRVGSVNETLFNTTALPIPVTYAYTLVSNGCLNTQNVTLTVKPKPVITSPNTSTICSGTSTNIALSSNIPGTTYTWSVGPITPGITGAAPGSGASINQVLNNTGSTAGTVTYLVNPVAGSCSGNQTSIVVTVRPSTGQTMFISGNVILCQNTQYETYTATALNSTSITYSVSPAIAGTINNFTGVMNWNAAFSGMATITATSSGICGTTSANRIVMVNPTTENPVFSTGNTTVCQNSADETYTATAANSTSISYSVSPSTAGVIKSSTGVMNWDAAYNGPVVITATAAGLCGTTSSSVNVTVNQSPTLIITNPSPVCITSTADLTMPGITEGSTAGLTFTYWTNATASSSYSTPSSASTGTYYIKGTAATTCYDIKPVTVTSRPLPVASAGGNRTICPGENATVSGADALYGNPLWTTDGAGTLSNPTSLTPTYRAAATDAGKIVSLTLTVTSNNECFPQTASAVYTILVKKSQEISFPLMTERVYGEGSFTLNATSNSLLDIVYTSGNNSTLSVSGNTATINNAGVTTIYANQPGNTAYCAAPEISQNVIVLQKLITATAKPMQAKYYGQPDPLLEYTINTDLIGNDVITGSPARTPGEDPGSNYIITKGTLDAGSNYYINFVPDNFTIKKGEITITVNPNQSKFYGDPDPAFTYSITPSNISSTEISGAPGRFEGENTVTSYTITQGSLSSDKYNINFIPGTFIIKAKRVIVTADPGQSKIYGEADPILTYTQSSYMVGSDQLSGLLSRDVGESVGNNYNITKGTLDAGPNYSIDFVSDKFTIIPKSIAIKPVPHQSKMYGDSDPDFKFTFSPEMIGLDGFTGALSRSSGENAGFYQINPGNLTAGPDYTLSFLPDSIEIVPRTINLHANAGQNKIYGSSDPVFTFSSSPELYNSDVITGSLARTAGEDAGTYAINIGTIAAGNNYIINFVLENFTIKKAQLFVTAHAAERHYLEPNPDFSLRFSGFVNGEDNSVLDVLPVVTTNAGIYSDAGNYNLEISGGSDNNYFYTYSNGILTVQKADQYITFDEITEKLRISQTYELVATASSGLPVSFGSSDLKKAVITGNTMLVNKEGRNIITARQEGNINWNPAPEVSISYVGQPSFDNITSLFTPNGDGVNDAWHIPEIEDFGSVQVKVYNRFGKLVYESSDYKNDWNGSFNGSPLPSASYYFIIKSSVKGIINGVVNIVR